jgi:hypothetical protein
MPVSTDPSTFEFTCNWLVSSETFVRDVMGATELDLDSARDTARARIHFEECLDAPNEDEEPESAPDLPPAINSRPRAIVITARDERTEVGIQTWAGSGTLLIDVEVPVPDAYRALT